MSRPLRIIHGALGRLLLVRLDDPVSEHALRASRLLFKAGGSDLQVRVGDHQFLLGDEAVGMVNPWQCHSHQSRDSSMPSLILSIEIDPVRLRPGHSCGTGLMRRPIFPLSCASIPVAAREAVLELVDLMAYDHDIDCKAAVLDSLTSRIFQAVTAAHAKDSEPGQFEAEASMACDARIRRVLSMMAAAADRPISINDLVKAARVSRQHFFHLFKQETRLTPVLYANSLRMECAIRAISDTEVTIAEIAHGLDFESAGNFTRFFKLQQGFSPSLYRRAVTVLPYAGPEPSAAKQSSMPESVNVHRSCDMTISMHA